MNKPGHQFSFPSLQAAGALPKKSNEGKQSHTKLHSIHIDYLSCFAIEIIHFVLWIL